MSYFYYTMFYNFILVPILIIGQTIDPSVSSILSGDRGLIFEKVTVDRLSDSSYTDIIQLLKLSEKTQAIQFRLSFNNASDDSTILFFEDLEKGSDLSDPGWLLDFNVIKGQVLINGASKDEVFVVLYNLNQDGGLLPGDYSHFITVKYRVADASILKSDLKSSIKIINAEASTSEGFAVDIKPSRDEFKILIESQ